MYQELLLILEEYWDAHPDLHGVPIYQASALATRALSIFQTYIEMMNDDIKLAFQVFTPALPCPTEIAAERVWINSTFFNRCSYDTRYDSLPPKCFAYLKPLYNVSVTGTRPLRLSRFKCNAYCCLCSPPSSFLVNRVLRTSS